MLPVVVADARQRTGKLRARIVLVRVRYGRFFGCDSGVDGIHHRVLSVEVELSVILFAAAFGFDVDDDRAMLVLSREAG